MKNINSYIADSISKYADEVLFVEQTTGERLTFREFGEQLKRVASVLQAEGVKEGDIITLVSKNSIDLAVMLYGVIAYGAIAMPLNPQLTNLEFSTLLKHSGSKIIFADRRTGLDEYQGSSLDIAAYRGFPPLTTGDASPVALNELNENEQARALLIYTSGTTGNPKGILLTHLNIAHNVLTAVEKFALKPGHTKVCILPLFHMFGFISDLSTMLFCGGKVVIMEVFDISTLALLEDALQEHEVNSFSAVPLMFELLIRFGNRINPPSMKFCISGAAPLKKETAVEFRERFGYPIIPAYGLTESTCFATISPLDAIVDDSIGLPANIEMTIVSDSGDEPEPYEIGEVALKGKSIMAEGYFRGHDDPFSVPQKSWFKTGDLGYRDEQGYFYLTGRKKNMIIRGGEKVYLEDVDACLYKMVEIQDSATVSYEDKGLESVACFVVLEKRCRLSVMEVKAYITERAGELKCPDVVIFLDAIPRTHTNKIKIRELQQLAESLAMTI
jgi:long-chain acyl-CoA synthetase